MNGIVKYFNNTRGFGFIAPLIGRPDTAEEVFFHTSSLVGLKPGERAAVPIETEVSFDLVRGKGGRPQAANVRLVRINGKTLAGAHKTNNPHNRHSSLGDELAL